MAQLRPHVLHSLSNLNLISANKLITTSTALYKSTVTAGAAAVMVLSVLLKFIYPPLASVVGTAMSALSFVSMVNAGLMEVKGKSVQYSKLRSSHGKAEVSSKVGMIAAYTPAFLVGISSLFIFPVGNLRFTLVRAAITTHFFKRLFEVLFVHKYSGSMEKETMVSISVSYFLYSATMIYCQQLMVQLPEPSIDLKYMGIPIFIVGIGGNLYHHYLLSKLRSEGEKQYKIPQGGLFSVVICPHYFFEIIGFWGISCISQTLYSVSFSLGSTLYLMGRSYATRRWYQSKFEDFPQHIKALIPFIF